MIEKISDFSCMDGLLTLYIASAIFGGGVISIDLLGFLGAKDDEHGDEDGEADDGGDDGDDGDEGDDEDHGDDGDHGGVSDGKGSVIMHHDRSNTQVAVLKAIGALKTLVYFSFGFGATGWFALQVANKIPLESLLWSGGVGVVMAAGARALKRIQRNEFDSSFQNKELLFAEAQVIVKIEAGGIGKIRIPYNGIELDRFAKAENPQLIYNKGETVRVVNITDEYFFVE